MTTCARSLYVDLFSKISLSGSPHPDPVEPLKLLRGSLVEISAIGPLVQDVRVRISASESCIGPLIEDLLADYNRETLPASRAIDTHDLRRRLHLKIRKDTLPAFCAMDTHEGCTWKSENATLPGNQHEPEHGGLLSPRTVLRTFFWTLQPLLERFTGTLGLEQEASLLKLNPALQASCCPLKLQVDVAVSQLQGSRSPEFQVGSNVYKISRRAPAFQSSRDPGLQDF